MTDKIQTITMPKWGLAMTEGLVAAWTVEEGAEINAGDEIIDIETEKITNAHEAPATGTLRRKVVAEGVTVPVGALLGVVADGSVSDANIDAFIEEFNANFVVEAAEEDASGPEPETVAVSGSQIRYLKLGDAACAPIVLIHGFGGDLNNWLFNQPALAETHTVYALDLPGHGGSSKQLDGADIESMASTVVAFLDAMKIDKAHVAGHSMGGAVTAALAVHYGARVASATLICAGGLGPEINMDYISGFIEASRRKQLKLVLEKLFADPGLVSRDMMDDILKYKRLDGAEAALKAISEATFAGGRQQAVLVDQLGDAQCPLQVIWGREDQIIPVTHAESLPDSIPRHIFDGAGHMVHMEKAGEVNKLLQEFVGNASRPS